MNTKYWHLFKMIGKIMVHIILKSIDNVWDMQIREYAMF